ncbi:MAG: ribosome recycling factor [Deltaproteobacteria bacterium]
MDKAIYSPIEEKMKKTLSVLKEELATVRAGRANPAILDKIMVDYYGVPTKITQLGNVSVPEARVLLIQPWEAKMLKDIEKEIQKSEIGINPNNDGKVIRLTFPELSEERRKELVKGIKKKGEDTKVAIRSIRRDAIEEFKVQKKNSEITEDDLKDIENDIQKLTDKNIEEIDKVTAGKEKEIMEV